MGKQFNDDDVNNTEEIHVKGEDPRREGVHVSSNDYASSMEGVDVKSKAADNNNIGDEHKTESIDEQTTSAEPYKTEIVWQNIIKFIILHSFAVYGLYLLPSSSWKTWLFVLVSYLYSGLGITAGAHRLWAHKTYKAKFPLRLFLAVANSMAGENSIYVWSRDHRVHHKCSETEGDPHNANRGFFFAHMGWLLMRKHPAVIRAGNTIDMSDLKRDPLVMFQHRHYIPTFLIASFVIPTFIPYYFWDESLTTAYFVAVFRYVMVLHFTWFVNSLAHFFGQKPYDKNIGPVENMIVSVLAIGEGFHNYHHVFPYDYSTSEWGFKFNLTTAFIDTMAAVGQAYDRRRPKAETIAARATRTGNIEQTKVFEADKNKVL